MSLIRIKRANDEIDLITLLENSKLPCPQEKMWKLATVYARRNWIISSAILTLRDGVSSIRGILAMSEFPPPPPSINLAICGVYDPLLSANLTIRRANRTRIIAFSADSERLFKIYTVIYSLARIFTQVRALTLYPSYRAFLGRHVRVQAISTTSGILTGCLGITPPLENV